VGDLEQTDDRVLRGGSWISVARCVRCAIRFAFGPGLRVECFGFRPVAYCRAAFRDWVVPGWRYSLLGFRPVAEVKEISLEGEGRVLRGGSWFDVAAICRAAHRRRVEPGRRFSNRGFRPVAEAARPQQGFYRKYNVTKTDGSPVDPNAQYLVLRLDTDRAIE
jgi:formylglycine-generating enzyme required for sulfatase activity